MILPCVERGREAGLPSNLPIDGHSFRRVEVLTGVPRRRRWSAAEKAAIVAESLAPGAVASTVALRHGLHRNQLYMWRRELRSGALPNRGIAMPDFVPIVPERRSATRPCKIVGGDHAAAAVGLRSLLAGRKPGWRRRKACSSVSFSTAVRTSRKGCTVGLLQRICCALAMRQAMISSTALSTNA